MRKSSSILIVGMLVVVALAIAYWMLLLSPKRDEVAKLGEQVEGAETTLAQHRAEIAAGEQARRQFPSDYRTLVVLGKAVPAGDETASLLVQVNGIAVHSDVRFNDLQLSSAEGSSTGEEGSAAASSSTGAQVSATEAAASLLPLGATIGPAGLAVMPYSLTFEGDFFEIADFIEGLDAMVETKNEEVTVNGRLITISDFTLAPEEGEAKKSAKLTATFTVTTYLTPPGEGLTAGASPSSPGEHSATPAATTTGGAP